MQEAQKAHKEEQHNQPTTNHQVPKNPEPILQQMHWAAAMVDSKFHLAHPLALDRIIKLEQKMQEEKKKLDLPTEELQKLQKQYLKESRQKSIKSHLNHSRPDSAHSRDCKTETNEFKMTQNKKESEQQLIAEEEKYKAKLERLAREKEKQKSAQNKSNKSGADFIIKDSRASSHKNGKKSNDLSSKVIIPHQLQNSKVSERKSQNSRVKEGQTNFVSFHPNETRGSPKFLNNSQSKKKDQFRQLAIKDNLRYSAQQKPNNKSFVINSRKTPSQSKDYKESLRKEINSSNSVTSKMKIQKLNAKIKQLQEKLHNVEKRQDDLEKLQQSRVQQLEQQKSRVHDSRVQDHHQNAPNQQHEQKPQKQKTQKERSMIQHKNIDSDQDKIGKDHHQISDLHDQPIDQNIPDPSDKNYSIQKSAKVAQIQSNKGSEKSEDGSKRETIFDMVVSKNKKFDFSSSIYSYNYSEENKKEEKKPSEKENMAKEIADLKKTIRQLKLERIKHQAIIEQIQVKDRQTLNQQLLNNKLGESEQPQNKTQNSRIAQQRLNTENKSKQKTEMSVKPEQVQIIFNKKQKESSKGAGVRVTRALRRNDNFRKQPTKQKQNPEEYSGKEFHPRSLSRRGIIVRQILNTSSDHIDLKSFAQSNLNNISRNQNDFQPPSPTSTGRKVFQLEFVHAEKEDSEVSEEPQINIPQIQIEPFPVPDLPAAPKPDISQTQLLALANKICETFQIIVEKDEHLGMKKYKNCIIFKTPDPKKTILWHYSGKFYVGGWEQYQNGEGKKNGEGFQYLPEKHYYKGQFYEGKKNGSGSMMHQNGNIYQGQWQKGEKHGHGKQLQKHSGTYYEGEWKNGKKDGKGVQKVSEKQYYDGTFVKSVKHGFGTELFPNGDYYHGQYKNGRFHGKGKYIWANGSSYDGHFAQGHRQGQGRWKSSKTGGDKYVGEYKQDKKWGKGKYQWANGCIYEGSFFNDLKHGQGRVNYPDGRQIKGYWEMGKLSQIQSQTNPQGNSQSRLLTTSIKPSMKKMIESSSKELQSSKFMCQV